MMLLAASPAPPPPPLSESITRTQSVHRTSRVTSNSPAATRGSLKSTGSPPIATTTSTSMQAQHQQQHHLSPTLQSTTGVASQHCDACTRCHQSCNRSLAGCARCKDKGHACTYTRSSPSTPTTASSPASASSASSSPHSARSKRKREKENEKPNDNAAAAAAAAAADTTSDMNATTGSSPTKKQKRSSPRTRANDAATTSNDTSSHFSSPGSLPVSHCRKSVFQGDGRTWVCKNAACRMPCKTAAHKLTGVCHGCKTRKGETAPPSDDDTKMEDVTRQQPQQQQQLDSTSIARGRELLATAAAASPSTAAIKQSPKSNESAKKTRTSPRNRVLTSPPAITVAAPAAVINPTIPPFHVSPTADDSRPSSEMQTDDDEHAATETITLQEEEKKEQKEPEQKVQDAASSSFSMSPRRSSSLATETRAPTPCIAHDTIDVTPTSSAGIDSTPQSNSSGDIEMKLADDDAELFSLSQDHASTAATSSALGRTFSTAATPSLSQDDENELEPLSMESPLFQSLPSREVATPVTSLADVTRSMSAITVIPGAPGASEHSHRQLRSPVKLKRTHAFINDLTPPEPLSAPASASSTTLTPSPRRPIPRSGNKSKPRTPQKSSRTPPATQSPISNYALNDLTTTATSLASSHFSMNAAAGTCCGFYRKLNQDSFVCQAIPMVAPFESVFLTAVFDGHGILGHLAAEQCRTLLPLLLTQSLYNGMSVDQALEASIAEMHSKLNIEAEIIRTAVHSLLPSQTAASVNVAAAAAASSNSSLTLQRRSSRNDSNAATAIPKPPVGGLYGADYGTTCIIAVVQGSTLYIANVGDSRCMVLQRDATRGASLLSPPSASPSSSMSSSSPQSTQSVASDWTIVHVSDEHNGDDEAERDRVVADGGSLHHTGTEYRVYPASMTFQEARTQQLTINMSRSLGHIKLGVHGISALPYIKTMELSDACDTMIVLGSDGLFDVLDFQSIREIVAKGTADTETIRDLLQQSDLAWQHKRHGDNITAAVTVCRPTIRQ